VEFFIKDSLKKYVKNVVVYLKKIIKLHLVGKQININLIQVYMALRTDK